MKQLVTKLLPVLVLLGGTVACQNAALPEEDTRITFRLESPSTRATGISAADERAVSRWCVFVATGNSIAATGVSDGNGAIDIEVNVGTYDIYAVANYESSFNPSSFRTVSSLLGYTSYLPNNRKDALVMYGEKTGTPITRTTGSIRIDVRRLCARVSVQRIGIDFSGRPALSGKSFVIKDIYLSNVYLRATLQEPSSWTMPESLYGNKMGVCSSSGSDLLSLVADRNIQASVTAALPYTTPHHFYTYANGTLADSHATAWCHRYTRLVIAAYLGGELRYYTADIPDIRRNHTYVIEQAVIKGRGSDDPEQPAPDDLVIVFSTSTQPWASVINISETS